MIKNIGILVLILVIIFISIVPSCWAGDSNTSDLSNVSQSLDEQPIIGDIKLADLYNLNLTGNTSLSLAIGEYVDSTGMTNRNVTVYIYGDNDSMVNKMLCAVISNNSIERIPTGNCIGWIKVVTVPDTKKYTDIPQSNGTVGFSDDGSLMRFELSNGSVDPVKGFRLLKPYMNYTTSQLSDSDNNSEILEAYKDYQKILL